MKRNSFYALALLLATGVLAAVPYGSLEITAEPGTTILWDGIDLGTTDASGRMIVDNAPLGSYTLTARKQGFDDLVREVEITAGAQSVVLRPSVRPATTPASVPLASAPATTPPDALPDPFARRTTAFGVLLPSVILILVAAGVFLLMWRREEHLEEEIPEPVDGPRLAFDQHRPGPRRPPQFYDDLRQREATLEGFEEREAPRPAPKIIELPVADRRPREDDS